MSKLHVLKTYEKYLIKQRSFKNMYWSNEWINFSCPLAPYVSEHKFKEDMHPSAGITIGDDGVCYYKCFTCKHQGPFARTLERLEKKSKQDYSELRSLVEQEEVLPDYEYLVTRHEKIKPEPLPFQDIFEDIEKYPDAAKYLLSRNVSLTTAKNIGLQYDPEGKRIVFPVRDRQGKTYGFTGRSILPDAKPKIKDYYFQKSMFILGVELWKPDQGTVIVEGLFGYAHLHEITKGRYFPYNIGAIMGSSVSEDQAESLIAFGQPIFALLDNDKAGQTGQKGKNGLVHFTKDHVPTMMLKWPKQEIEENGLKHIVEKVDPDQLTYDELFDMILNPRLVI